MNKKILIVCLIAVAIVSVGVVSAADTFTLGGIDFNIPDGFKKDDAKSNDTSVWLKSNNDSVLVSVLDSKGVPLEKMKDDGDVEKNIAGKQGYFSQGKYSVFFLYKEGDKFVHIGAGDEATIEAIIK